MATTYSSESRKSTILFIFMEYMLHPIFFFLQLYGKKTSNLEVLGAQLQVHDRLHIFSCEF